MDLGNFDTSIIVSLLVLLSLLLGTFASVNLVQHLYLLLFVPYYFLQVLDLLLLPLDGDSSEVKVLHGIWLYRCFLSLLHEHLFLQLFDSITGTATF